jgi:integrase
LLLTREHMQRIVNKRAGTPFAQRNFLNTLRSMFRWAMKEGRIPDDPTLGVTREKAKTAGYKTWSEDHIARFEAAYPIGTKGRLAFALLLYTGQRRGDVVKMGRHRVNNGVLTIDQGKTEGGEEAHLEIPVHPKLRDENAGLPPHAGTRGPGDTVGIVGVVGLSAAMGPSGLLAGLAYFSDLRRRRSCCRKSQQRMTTMKKKIG